MMYHTLLSLITGLATAAGPSVVYTTIILVLGLLVAVVILAIIAPFVKIPYPILLVFGGLLLAFVPNLPHFTIEPDIVFLLFLPPLLFSSAWQTSWRDFRANFRSIGSLAIGLVLVTTVVVGVVVHLIIPTLPWAVAFVIGAIISPTDAVAATSVAQRLGIPRRIVTILEGESMVNDATALVAYQFAVAAVVSGTFSLAQAGLQFVLLSVGGIALGLLIGLVVSLVLRFLNNPPLEITITLLTSFIAYLLAEELLHVSGVLAVVAAGLFLTWRSPNFFSPETRQQAVAFWNTLIFLLNGLVFILIGLQLPRVFGQLNDTVIRHSSLSLLWDAVIVCASAIIVRFVWAFVAIYVPHIVRLRLRNAKPYLDVRSTAVIGWTGLRGVLSLAAALALPEQTASGAAFPERSLVIFLVFCVIFATLVLQGLSLPLVIRLLRLKDDGATEREEILARITAVRAALTRIDELVEQGDYSDDMAEYLRTYYEARAKSLAKHSDDEDNVQVQDKHYDYQRLKSEILEAEYRSVVRLRNEGKINDEALRRVGRDIDLEAQRLE